MENFNPTFETESNEQSGLTLRLAYMVEDFMELIRREEKEKMVTEDN